MFQYTHEAMTQWDCKWTLQRGSALIISLVFLLAMTLIGVTAMQGTTQQEGMAGNTRNYNLAFQAAEAALRDGENFLAQSAVLPAFDNSTPGLIQPLNPKPPADLNGSVTYWTNYNWDAANSQQLPVGTLSDVIEQPRYVIERRDIDPSVAPCSLVCFNPPPPNNPPQQCAGPGSVGCFRITARGLGGTADAVSILQSIYARPL